MMKTKDMIKIKIKTKDIIKIIVYYMKTRKNMRKNMRKKVHKMVGGLFRNSNTSLSSECDIMNLSTISKDMGDGVDPLIKMKNNYAKCCPKNFIGRKNSSPYCKQLALNFDAQSKFKRDIAGYYGDETDVSKIKQKMNEPHYEEQMVNKKPNLFGGRKHRKHCNYGDTPKRKNRNKTRKNRNKY